MNETEHAEINTVAVSIPETEEHTDTANMNRIDYLTLLEELDHR